MLRISWKLCCSLILLVKSSSLPQKTFEPRKQSQVWLGPADSWHSQLSHHPDLSMRMGPGPCPGGSRALSSTWKTLGLVNPRVSFSPNPAPGAFLSESLLRVWLKGNFCSVLALGMAGGHRSPENGPGFLWLQPESATGSFVDIVLQRAVEMVESDRGPQTKPSERMRINSHF